MPFVHVSVKMLLCLLLCLATTRATSAITVADHGVAQCVIVVDSASTPAEVFAASELAAHLRKITGAEFVVETNAEAPARAILVGSGSAARKVFAEVPFDTLAPEELVMRT